MKFLTLCIKLFLALLGILRIKGEPDWTFEILELTTINNTPDLMNIDLDLKRIARGYFVVAGTLTLTEDLTDETIIHADLFDSPLGQHFVRTPFSIPDTPLSEFFNTFYKDLFMDALKECSTNPPLKNRNETFTPPWQKGVMVYSNCTFSNDDMPSHLRPGFYKFIFDFKNQVNSTITVLAKIEPK